MMHKIFSDLFLFRDTKYLILKHHLNRGQNDNSQCYDDIHLNTALSPDHKEYGSHLLTLVRLKNKVCRFI